MERLHSQITQIPAIVLDAIKLENSTNPSYCPQCHQALETLSHCFFECSVSAATSAKLGTHFISTVNSKVPPGVWVKEILEKLKIPVNSKTQIISFAFTLWKLWLAQNFFIFESKQLSPEEILAQADSLANHEH
ncbi:hypothetical protein HN51_027730 [Arachis hypogaea]